MIESEILSDDRMSWRKASPASFPGAKGAIGNTKALVIPSAKSLNAFCCAAETSLPVLVQKSAMVFIWSVSAIPILRFAPGRSTQFNRRAIFCRYCFRTGFVFFDGTLGLPAGLGQ